MPLLITGNFIIYRLISENDRNFIGNGVFEGMNDSRVQKSTEELEGRDMSRC